MPQSSTEKIQSARLIKNCIRSGMPVDEILQACASSQPAWRTKWQLAAKSAAKGGKLSTSLFELKIWDDVTCAAVAAGEVSGSLAGVMEQIIKLENNSSKIRSTILGKLTQPAIYIIGGASAFIGAVLSVFPAITGGVAKRDRVGIVETADNMREFLINDWWMLAVGIALLIALVVSYFVNSNVKYAVDRTVSRWPYMGSGLRMVYMSVWSSYMVMLDLAGDVELGAMIQFATDAIPRIYRPAFEKMKYETLGAQGFFGAVDTMRMQPSDPRQAWPLLLKAGLRSAATTSKISTSLEEVSEALLEEGIIEINKFMTVVSSLAMGVGAALIASPMAFFGLIQAQQLANVGK